MVTEQRQVSIEDDGGLQVHLNTVKTKNVKEKEKVETVSGYVEQDSRNSNSTAGGSKSVQHNSDLRMDNKVYDKSRIKSVQNVMSFMKSMKTSYDGNILCKLETNW